MATEYPMILLTAMLYYLFGAVCLVALCRAAHDDERAP